MFLHAAVSLVLLANESFANRLTVTFASGDICTTNQSAANTVSIVAPVAAAKYYLQDENPNSNPRHMVIFRAPSRHTFGFIDGTAYDLPDIELRTLLCSMVASEQIDIQFVPVDNTYEDTPQLNATACSEFLNKTFKSQNQSKKKISGNIIPRNNHLLRWILCANEISTADLAGAVSRAVLTHASFSIYETLNITEGDWQDAAPNRRYVGTHKPSTKLFDNMNIIEMSHPNMSQSERNELLETIASIIERRHELEYRLDQLYSANSSLMSTHDVKYQQPVLIHHVDLAVTRGPDNYRRRRHHIYFGYRTAIGLAGTSGAPSQTLRRPQRGLLKKYALKNRQFTNLDNILLTSTAMEPEIGFLMANLALAGNDDDRVSVGSRILDPCCGSGRLLLYAAALGATRLTGIDSDSSVWSDAIDEFRNHRIVGTSSPLSVPVFFRGDVHIPSLTNALCIPNSFDVIVCDPPYNIGAPVLLDGKDLRPRNHHHDKDVWSNSQPIDKIGDKKANAIATGDIIPSILAIAKNVLVNGGRIVFFLPVRGEEMKLSLEELLSKRHWLECGNDSKDASDCCLQLLKHSSRKQMFSHTFCRWLVVMKSIRGVPC